MSPTTAPTFSELLVSIATDPDLRPARRKSIATNVRTFVRVARIVPGRARATIPTCREIARSVDPAAHELKAKYWTTIKSDLAFAIRRYSPREPYHRLPSRLAPAWHRLRGKADGSRIVTHGLSRFMRFCSVSGVPPSQVSADVACRYRAYLDEHSLIHLPDHSYRRMVRAWNWARSHVPGWPRYRLTPPTRATYTLPMAAFPPSFQKDARKWFACVTATFPLVPRAPLRPLTAVTAERRLRYLRAIASAMVHEGVSIERIVDLKTLTHLPNLRKAVRFFWRRAHGKNTSWQYGAYEALRHMARHWAEIDGRTLAELEKLVVRTRRRSRSISERNLAILRQFDNPRTVQRLLLLPQLLVNLARRRGTTRAAALMVQRALAIELLLGAPIRLGNLASLRLTHHFVEMRTKGRRQVRLVIPREETKNRMQLEFPLSDQTVELLDLYVAHYLPKIRSPNRKRYLFPAKVGGHVGEAILGLGVRRALQCYVGVRMTIHSFRHLAVKFLLERFPQRFDLAALLLGHRSVDTTRTFYSTLEMKAVAAQYSTEVLGRTFADSVPVYARRDDLDGSKAELVPLLVSRLAQRPPAPAPMARRAERCGRPVAIAGSGVRRSR